MATEQSDKITDELQEGIPQAPPVADHDSSVLDLAFAIDVTASMGPYIEQAQMHIRHIVEEIVAAEKSDVRLALVEYRDHPPQCNSFVTRTNDFTDSIKTMKKWLDMSSPHGGGDEPEALADALHDVMKLDWRPEATKICVLITDAPPHGLIGGIAGMDYFPEGCPLDLDPVVIVREMAKKNITLYSVGCETSIVSIYPYRDFYMALSYVTGGQYVPLRNANLLSKIIIGGAQEEITLHRLMGDVRTEMFAEGALFGAGGAVIDEEEKAVIDEEEKAVIDEEEKAVIDEEEIALKIYKKFREKGVRTKSVFGSGAPEKASELALKMTSKGRTLKEWREEWEKSPASKINRQGGFSLKPYPSAPWPGFNFRTPTITTASVVTFGGFSIPITASVTFGGFSIPIPASVTLGRFSIPITAGVPFGGFGNPTTASVPFGGFSIPTTTSVTSGGFGIPKTTSATSGGFGIPTTASATSGGFGIPTTTSATSGGFGIPTTASATSSGFTFGFPTSGGLDIPLNPDDPLMYRSVLTNADSSVAGENLKFGNSSTPETMNGPFGPSTRGTTLHGTDQASVTTDNSNKPGGLVESAATSFTTNSPAQPGQASSLFASSVTSTTASSSFGGNPACFGAPVSHDNNTSGTNLISANAPPGALFGSSTTSATAPSGLSFGTPTSSACTGMMISGASNSMPFGGFGFSNSYSSTAAPSSAFGFSASSATSGGSLFGASGGATSTSGSPATSTVSSSTPFVSSGFSNSSTAAPSSAFGPSATSVPSCGSLFGATGGATSTFAYVAPSTEVNSTPFGGFGFSNSSSSTAAPSNTFGFSGTSVPSGGGLFGAPSGAAATFGNHVGFSSGSAFGGSAKEESESGATEDDISIVESDLTLEQVKRMVKKALASSIKD